MTHHPDDLDDADPADRRRSRRAHRHRRRRRRCRDGDEQPGGLTWGRVAVLGVALAFLGFAVGMFVTRDRPPGADSVDVGFLPGHAHPP